MSQHPLLDLVADPKVRRAADFRGVAEGITGADLAGAFEQEVGAAPHRHEAGRKHFVAYSKRLAAERKPARDGEHLSLALLDHCRRTGAGLALPDGEATFDAVAAQVMLQAAGEKAEGAKPLPVGRIDLLGLGAGDRLAIAQIRYLAPGATRAGTGDTPLAAVLQALARAAIAVANRGELASEIADAGGRAVSEEPPLVALIGSPRYWELCRRREAQKGAAWIHQLERIARELEEASGISLLFLACHLEGDPGWSYPEGSPVLDAPPRLTPAWEVTAGRVKPKARARPKVGAPAEVRVEADLSRPIRDYALSERFAPGDRISHPKLGLGVVQGIVGPCKMAVLFEDRKIVLVQDRPAGAATSPGF